MSYPPPQGAAAYYGAPPMQVNSPPPNGAYNGSQLPQGHHPQPGYGQHPPPPQNYPGYAAPSPQGYPPPGQYAPPQAQGPYPPVNAPHNAPPPHGYPPHQSQTQQFPQQYPHSPYQTGYGPPPVQHPPQQYGPPMGPQSSPSPGYIFKQNVAGDASREADALEKAIKGMGTNNKVLIDILAKPDPIQMTILRNSYSRKGRDLERDVRSDTSGHYGQALVALVQGPLMHDVKSLKDAVAGFGTKEIVLNDVLLGRSNADMHAIKFAYHATFHTSLESDVSDDLSGDIKKLFQMVMTGNRAEESTLIAPQSIQNDVDRLNAATKGKVDGMAVCSILASRSDGQLRAINAAFNTKSGVPFESVIKKKISLYNMHMKQALLTIWRRALDRSMYDAQALEKCMKGMGTKDDLLVQRIVRVHWDRQHLAQVKRAYSKKFGKDLSDRVRGEIGVTSMNYRKLMLAIIA